jgi:hypothetical protein
VNKYFFFSRCTVFGSVRFGSICRLPSTLGLGSIITLRLMDNTSVPLQPPPSVFDLDFPDCRPQAVYWGCPPDQIAAYIIFYWVWFGIHATGLTISSIYTVITFAECCGRKRQPRRMLLRVFHIFDLLSEIGTLISHLASKYFESDAIHANISDCGAKPNVFGSSTRRR